MVINDFSTTISCGRCSKEHTIEGKNYSERTMRRLAKKIGWQVVDGEDVCPSCLEREKKDPRNSDGHFTATQLLRFKETAENTWNKMRNHRSTDSRFLCPLCGTWVTIVPKIGIDAYAAECSGCGVSFRKE